MSQAEARPAKQCFLDAVENLRRVTGDHARCDDMLRDQEEWEARLDASAFSLSLAMKKLQPTSPARRTSAVARFGFGGRRIGRSRSVR